jgi:Flp pilus assembly protein TadG
MKTLLHTLRRFGQEDRGNLMVEAVLVLPFMLWAYVGLFVYWDAFRSVNAVQKAAYTVSDMISREMITISPAYLTGMDSVMERLVDSDQDVAMRVTSVYYDEVDARNEVHWSVSPNSAMTPLTTTTLQDFAGQIPAMSDGDYVVIVEVSVGYTPSFNVGISDLELRQFIVTRPRFVPRICMEGFACS